MDVRYEMAWRDAMWLVPDRVLDQGYLPMDTRVFVQREGNFTTVAFVLRGGAPVMGVSKRTPTDKRSDAGLRVALTRAFRNYVSLDKGFVS